MDIAGATALVTGGASGLGLATVRRLRDRGARVVILDLPSSAGDAVAKELGAGTVFASGDVTSPADVAAAVQAAGELGPLRIAVNCAGIGTAARTVGKNGPSPLEDFTRVVTVNLIGASLAAHIVREPDAQRRDDPPRRRHPDSAALAAGDVTTMRNRRAPWPDR
jgi:NAD(P)-dependent dehydrogenase (short-subunit alcohol dehydrogenase family)